VSGGGAAEVVHGGVDLSLHYLPRLLGQGVIGGEFDIAAEVSADLRMHGHHGQRRLA
jgi:hypothetical protein